MGFLMNFIVIFYLLIIVALIYIGYLLIMYLRKGIRVHDYQIREFEEKERVAKMKKEERYTEETKSVDINADDREDGQDSDEPKEF